MSLTLADVVVLAIVALSTLVALIRGFVREALSILAWAGAALITAYLFDPLRPLADDMIASETAGDIATIAVIFLVSAHYHMATAYIIGRVENGDYGVAIAYSSVLILVMLVAVSLVQFLISGRVLGRRTATPSARKVPA